MTLKVIGAGFGRTGTSSLQAALATLLGEPCYHMGENLTHTHHPDLWMDIENGETPDWDAIFDGYGAAVDWPAAKYWDSIAAFYPKAKVLLSVRDAGAWYDSVRRTIYDVNLNPPPRLPEKVRQMHKMVQAVVWEGVFQGKFEDREFAIGVFKKNVDRVKRTISSDRLLVYQLGSGWRPICKFLDSPVPNVPFPSENSTGTFRAKVARKRRD